MEKVRFGFITALLIAVLIAMFFLHWKDIKHAVSHETTSEVQISDSSEPLMELSVEEYLTIREDLRLAYTEDSIFRNMPEQILTYILVQKGTNLSVSEIVTEYLNNQELYDKKIKSAMDIQKKYIPDSVPSKAKLDEPVATPPNVAEK